jgi:hypothetical protein
MLADFHALAELAVAVVAMLTFACTCARASVTSFALLVGLVLVRAASPELLAAGGPVLTILGEALQSTAAEAVILGFVVTANLSHFAAPLAQRLRMCARQRG